MAHGTAAAEMLTATGAGQTLIGGGGNDIFNIGTHVDAKIVESGSGVSEVLTSAASYALSDGVNNLAGAGNSSATLIGNSAANVIYGNNGNDVLNGGGGDDKLVIGTGHNVLTGGTGHDTFVFSSPRDRANVVTDFSTGQDVLDLRPLLKAMHYGGSDPVADHVLRFSADGAGDTIVSLNAHGTTHEAWHAIVTLDHVLPSALHSGTDYSWH